MNQLDIARKIYTVPHTPSYELYRYIIRATAGDLANLAIHHGITLEMDELITEIEYHIKNVMPDMDQRAYNSPTVNLALRALELALNEKSQEPYQYCNELPAETTRGKYNAMNALRRYPAFSLIYFLEHYTTTRNEVINDIKKHLRETYPE